MVRVLNERWRHGLDEPLLHFEWVLTRGESRAIRDAEDVRVDGDRGLAERDVQHDIGRLATHAGQFFQRFTRARHLAVMLTHNDFR